MRKIVESFFNFKNQLAEEQTKTEKIDEITQAKQDLQNAWSCFNEATESSYIDIAILNLNLAKKRFEVKLSEVREDNYLKQA
jgi:hypothetical protein